MSKDCTLDKISQVVFKTSKSLSGNFVVRVHLSVTNNDLFLSEPYLRGFPVVKVVTLRHMR